jgi:predicted GIY-YIG superfamily endonuclease
MATSSKTVYYIYALRNPDNDEFFYVGATKHPERRLVQHIEECGGRGLKSKYISKMASHPELHVLYVLVGIETSNLGVHPDNIKKSEQSWIKALYEQGHPLTNREAAEYRKFEALADTI